MHYKYYSTEDFIQDDFFQQWVFFPNEERTRYWETFILHHPLQQEKIAEAREFLLSMNFETGVPESVVQELRFNINNAIDELESGQDFHPKGSGSPGRSRTIYAIAASLFLIGMAAVYGFIDRDIRQVIQRLTLEEETTPQGKQRHLTLSDGTQVWLNAGSEFRYPGDFSNEATREVYLVGEAFFEVSENKEKPFVVHTSGLDIKVLGTAFNVKAYEKDLVVETTLVKGKVSLAPASGDSAKEITLLPNQQALFSKASRAIALEGTVDTENYTGWRNGWMIFDDRPFSYIKETLERWYDVTIVLEDERSLSCTYSAKFKDKTLREVLEIFSNTGAINYRIDGNQVFINGRLCHYENPK